MLAQFRLFMAETLLGWALAVAPPDHPDSQRMISAIRDYLKSVLQ
jgi:hypothetical protein